MKKLAFKVRLDGMEGSSVAALSAPFSVEKVFGTKARVPVRGTINGFPFRSSLSPMAGCHRMVVNRTIGGFGKRRSSASGRGSPCTQEGHGGK